MAAVHYSGNTIAEKDWNPSLFAFVINFVFYYLLVSLHALRAY